MPSEKALNGNPKGGNNHVDNKDFLHFGNRLDLAEDFEKWAEENKVEKSTLGILSYLEIRGLLNVQKTLEYLHSNFRNKEVKDDEQ